MKVNSQLLLMVVYHISHCAELVVVLDLTPCAEKDIAIRIVARSLVRNRPVWNFTFERDLWVFGGSFHWRYGQVFLVEERAIDWLVLRLDMIASLLLVTSVWEPMGVYGFEVLSLLIISVATLIIDLVWFMNVYLRGSSFQMLPFG